VDFLETVANFEFSLSYSCSGLEINKKWLLLPQKHNMSKNLLTSVISEWVHVVMCINHRIVPVSLPEDKICICVHNKGQKTIINTVTGVETEQSRNSGKMIISRQFINPLQMWHTSNFGNDDNESE